MRARAGRHCAQDPWPQDDQQMLHDAWDSPDRAVTGVTAATLRSLPCPGSEPLVLSQQYNLLHIAWWSRLYAHLKCGLAPVG